MKDNYEFEIKQRESILEKVRNCQKITHDERIWLLTHSTYNSSYDFPVFNVVIENLEPRKRCLIKVTVESASYDMRIIPIIGVPAGKGHIVTNLNLYNIDGEAIDSKNVKFLGFEHSDTQKEFEVECYSELGFLSVEYECDYFDAKQNLYIRKSSSAGHWDFAMTRKVIDEHTIRYCCKSPVDSSFDAMIFVMEINPINNEFTKD